MAFPDKMSDDPSPPGWESRCLQEQVDLAGVRWLANEWVGPPGALGVSGWHVLGDIGQGPIPKLGVL